MPLVTVDYSDRLKDGFDREGFAKALRAELVATAAARPEACKTRYVPTEGAGDGEPAVLHVSIALLPGRTEETKAKLTENVLDLLRAHLGSGVEPLHASAEVRELDASYRQFQI
jgi:5-carboxymethyl-2-hydroxymuconate isomerase